MEIALAAIARRNANKTTTSTKDTATKSDSKMPDNLSKNTWGKITTQ